MNDSNRDTFASTRVVSGEDVALPQWALDAVNAGPLPAADRRVVAWFSHGACSAVACKMAVEEYGPSTRIVAIHLGGEHEDNARFRADCEQWLGHEIEVITSDRYTDHLDVALTRRYVNGPGGAACTAWLKKAVRHAFEEPTDLHIWGYATDQRDFKRAVRFEVQNPGVDSWYPLVSRGLSKSNCLAMVERAGIELPEMYRLGYVNNNCIGCWKGGKGYWNKIRIDFPERFAACAAVEQTVGASSINGTFLDDLVPGTGRYKAEEVACDLNCSTVESEWQPVAIGAPHIASRPPEEGE